MTTALSNTAIILVASGLSRRFGRRDKMLATLGGLPLVEHSARAIASLHPLTKVAVCPADRPEIGERLIDRFVVAVNKKPKQGLGHSIAVGVQIALQFRPEAIMVCMGDMPFIEPWLLEALARQMRESRADVIHAGDQPRPHPPTLFGKACFDQLAALDGDGGAKSLLRSDNLQVAAFNAPRPLLFDVDTPDDLVLAKQQLDIRTRCYSQLVAHTEARAPSSASPMTIELAAGRIDNASRVAMR